MGGIIAPVIHPGPDALVLQDLLQPAGGSKRVILPVTLSHTDGDPALVEDGNIFVVGRQIGQRVERGVHIKGVIHIAAVQVLCIISPGQGDQTAEQVRPAEEKVGRVVGSHGDACHDDLFFTAADLMDPGDQLCRNILEPLFIKCHTACRRFLVGGDGFCIDRVRRDDLDLSVPDPVADIVDHTEIFPVIESAVAAGQADERPAGCAVDLEFHISSQ